MVTFSLFQVWILNCSLFPAVIGYPNLFYSYGSVSSALILSGSILNQIGMRLGRNVITYKLKGLITLIEN